MVYSVCSVSVNRVNVSSVSLALPMANWTAGVKEVREGLKIRSDHKYHIQQTIVLEWYIIKKEVLRNTCAQAMVSP